MEYTGNIWEIYGRLLEVWYNHVEPKHLKKNKNIWDRIQNSSCNYKWVYSRSQKAMGHFTTFPYISEFSSHVRVPSWDSSHIYNLCLSALRVLVSECLQHSYTISFWGALLGRLLLGMIWNESQIWLLGWFTRIIPHLPHLTPISIPTSILPCGYHII